jgi:ubiquinone biosynthesis monooxygenase Coq7
LLDTSFIDKAVSQVDSILRSKTKSASHVARTNPAAHINNNDNLSEIARKQSLAMMRVNHSGEICAQALYQGQALMARSLVQYNALLQAASEETDHLHWCQARINELNGRTSLLNPLWYAGSFAIGAIAGIAGDKISLGFLAETEHQVTRHIEQHLARLPENDHKSRAILEQMRVDELQHATQAEQAGAAPLPAPIKLAMRITAKILTVTAAKI